LTRALLLLLAGCELLPPPGLGPCTYVAGGEYGTIMEAGVEAGPAFDCESYWRCETGSYYDGRTYEVGTLADVEISPGVWSSGEDETELWCDRCRWHDESAMFLIGGSWYDLLAECAWVSP
jgi:hypothetical protein